MDKKTNFLFFHSINFLKSIVFFQPQNLKIYENFAYTNRSFVCVFVNNTFLRNELSSPACFSFPYFIFQERRRKKILGKEPEIVSTKQYITKNIRIKHIVVARVRTASRRSFHPQGVCQCLSSKYGETMNSYLLSVENLNGSRHLVF